MQNQSNGNVVTINVVGSSVFGRYSKISSEKTYNMFISDDWLVSFAGWKRVLDLFPDQEAVGRGIFRSIRNSIVVAVINNVVFSITDSLFYKFIGTIATSVGDVFMDENLNNQICIVDGLNAYIYNYSLGTLTEQSIDKDVLIPNYVCYHNTFFLFGNGKTNGNGSAWYAYIYESPTTIIEETQLALQTKPDYAIAVERLPGKGNNVIVFGTSVAEIWTQVGGIQNYQRVTSMNIDYGCLSVSTIASSDKYVIWLGVNESNAPVITMCTGNTSMSISTDGIDYVLGNLKYPEQSTAFFDRDDGHLFYHITFYNPEDNLSLIYDIEQKKFFHISDADLNYHPASKSVYFNNNVYFISLNNGSLYQTGTNFTTYNENLLGSEFDSDPNINKEIPRIRICASVRQATSDPFLSKNLNLTLDQGNDPNFSALSATSNLNYLITEGPNSDFIVTETGERILVEGFTNTSIPYIPRIDLCMSKDGGTTFGSWLLSPLHPLGKRKNVMTWQRQFGYANDLIFKFRFWGTSYWCVSNATLEVY